MKTLQSVFVGALSTVILFNTSGAEFDIRKPPIDNEGRFWIYRDVKEGDSLPFRPYAWMPERATNLLTLDVTCSERPRVEVGQVKAGATCISTKVKWSPPNWCGVAFVSGDDMPQWWGEDNRGWYYDLNTLKKKKLVFHARSDTGARIQVKVGALGDKKYGDSLKLPAQTRWLKLPRDWTRYELDLSGYKPEQLRRICNGFTFVLSKDQNDGAAETVFFLDDIYLE